MAECIRSLIFFSLSVDLLAGRRDARLKSTSKRHLTVLELALQPVSATIAVENKLGFLTTARQILRSVNGGLGLGLLDGRSVDECHVQR